jgi:hypothetical protein
MGSLPAKSNYQNGSKKRYGSNGNIVCAVEFGQSKAKSLLGEIVVIHNRTYDRSIKCKKVNSKTFYFKDILKHAEKSTILENKH